MKYLLAAAVIGYAAASQYDRVFSWYTLRGQKRRFLTGGIAAYLDFLNSLPVKGGESQ